MSAVSHNAAQRSAQLSYDNQSPPEDDELVDSLLHDFRNDAQKIAEADTLWAGTIDMSDADSALADLHRVEPSDLLGSDVLARLYRLARSCHEARDSELRDMAQDEADKQRREAEDMRGDYQAMSRDAA